MNLSSITSHSSSRWALPFVLFFSIYKCFDFFEDKLSPDVRSKLSDFLCTGQYGAYLGILPDVIESTFNRVFGTKHFSWRCISVSIVFSIVSILLTLLFSLLYNHADLVAIVRWGLAAIPTTAAALEQNPKTATFGAALKQIGPVGFWILLGVGWIIWCVIPDYIMLLKTRIVILILHHTKPTMSSLVITAILDFVVGNWIFLASLSFFPAIVIGIYELIHTGNVQSLTSFATTMLVVSYIAFGLESLIVGLTGMLYFNIPIGNIFWASMIPSLWLWIYVFGALIARGLIASRPILDYAIRILDVPSHPFRSIGIVSGFAIAFLSLAFLLLVELVTAI